MSTGIAFLGEVTRFFRVLVVGTRSELVQGKTRILTLSLVQAVRGIALGSECDVVFSHGAFIGIFHSIMMRFIGRKQRHLILSVAMSYIQYYRFGTALATALVRVMRNTDVVFCHSTSEVNFWRRMGKAEVFFLPLCLEPGKVPPSGNRQEEAFLFSGGLADRDYSTLLLAIEGLPVRLVLAVGRNPLTKEYDLQERVLPPNVTLYKDITSKHFDELMARALFVVLPLKKTVHNAGQRVLITAINLGKPVVATANPGTSDYVKNYQSGILVAPGDANMMHEAISTLLHSDELRLDYGRESCDIAKQTCSPSAVAITFLAHCYESRTDPKQRNKEKKRI
jgi:glycosyltransferase involved in cell wall biosynthesis